MRGSKQITHQEQGLHEAQLLVARTHSQGKIGCDGLDGQLQMLRLPLLLRNLKGHISSRLRCASSRHLLEGIYLSVVASPGQQG